jgi:hypothetical protein
VTYKLEHPYGGGFDSSEGRFEGKAGDRVVFDESDRNVEAIGTEGD